jgi:hypothetical protein
MGWADLATVEACTEFSAARVALVNDPPAILVTNLRLREYNGLHLVYIARALNIGTRAIVFADAPNLEMFREVQESGAFFERAVALPTALRSYIAALLPTHDRRNGAADRRSRFRGGRRAIDLANLSDLPSGLDLSGADENDIEKT